MLFIYTVGVSLTYLLFCVRLWVCFLTLLFFTYYIYYWKVMILENPMMYPNQGNNHNILNAFFFSNHSGMQINTNSPFKASCHWQNRATFNIFTSKKVQLMSSIRIVSRHKVPCPQYNLICWNLWNFIQISIYQVFSKTSIKIQKFKTFWVENAAYLRD